MVRESSVTTTLDDYDDGTTLTEDDIYGDTWVLTSAQLALAYEDDTTPDLDSRVWSLNVYATAWHSVGLILDDEGFKHVRKSKLYKNYEL